MISFRRIEKFLSGEDTPRKYFERCLQVIEECNDEVKAWAFDNTNRAREMADAATKRYANQKPLSIIDGMPIGIKDLIETSEMKVFLLSIILNLR